MQCWSVSASQPVCPLPRHEGQKEANGAYRLSSSSMLGPGQQQRNLTRWSKCTGSVGSRLESLRLFAGVTQTRSAASRLAALRLFAAAGKASAATERAASIRPLATKGDAASSVVEELEEDVCELVVGKEVELTNSITFGGYLVEPKKNDNGAGVLLLTDILGHDNEDSRGYANRLACFGFTVLVPDLFRGQPWDTKRDLKDYESWRAKHTADALASDIATSTEFLKEIVKEKDLQPGGGRLAVIGFCLGGGRVIETLASDGSGGTFSAGVSFYGTRFDPELASQIRAPTLLLLGDSDELCPLKIMQEVESRLKKQGVENKVVVYEGRGHAFAHRPADMAEDQDSEDAFARMKEWLNGHLL